MKILLQSAKILSADSPFHKKTKNVLIHNGRITEVSDKNPSADRVVPAKGMILTIGWFDLGTFVGDPGLEQKEDLASVTRAAEAGGFTGLAVLPNTSPSVQTKNEVSYLMSGNPDRLVQIHPLASVTRNNKGEELTEMIDLRTAGAAGFTDGLKTVWHTDIFLKALQYTRKFDGVLVDHPEDTWLNLFGQMHEGVNSTMLGLKGMPGIAESLALGRNIDLLRYAGGRLHAARLSTAKSIDLVRQAKKSGLQITCDITGYQALLDDSMLADFDTNYKVNPPLREKKDNQALLKGLADGTIDVLCSGHVPQDAESKSLEFDQAEFGMINLQNFASNLVALSEKVEWDILMETVTSAPRKVLGLPVPVIEVGEPANLTLLDPAKGWTLNQATNVSKSINSPWWTKEVTGKVVAVFNNGKYFADAK